EAIAKDELVGDVEADVINIDIHDAARWLAKKRTNLDAGRVACLQHTADVGQGRAAVDDIFDDQDIQAIDVATQVHVDAHDPGGLADILTIAGHRQEINRVRHSNVAHQVGQEDDTALQYAGQQQIIHTGVIPTDLRSQFGNACLQGLFVNENLVKHFRERLFGSHSSLHFPVIVRHVQADSAQSPQ